MYVQEDRRKHELVKKKTREKKTNINLIEMKMFSLSETGFNKRLDISEEEISKLDNVAILLCKMEHRE